MALKSSGFCAYFFQRAILQQFPCSALNPYQKQYGLAVVWFIRLNLLACHAVNSRLRSAAMKAPVGLLSNGTVLRSKMEGLSALMPGMATTRPVMPSAHAAFLSPNFRTMVTASVCAPPDSSRIAPDSLLFVIYTVQFTLCMHPSWG